MKDRRNWKTWLLPIIAAASISAVLAFTAAAAKVNVHIESDSIHKDIESLDERYMPRETLEEKFRNIEASLARIEKAVGTKGD